MDISDKAKVTNIYNELYKSGHLLSHINGNLFVSDTQVSRRLLGNAGLRYQDKAYRTMYREDSYRHSLLMAENVFLHVLPNQAKFSGYFNAMCWDDENPYAIIQGSNPTCPVEVIHGYVKNLSDELMPAGESFAAHEAHIFLQSMIASQLAPDVKSEAFFIEMGKSKEPHTEWVNKPFDMVYREGFLTGLSPEQMKFREAIENAFNQVVSPHAGILDSLKDGIKQYAPEPAKPTPSLVTPAPMF